MDEMRNITLHDLEKYHDSTAYAPLALGIYKDLKKECYCICLEADKIPKYPLRSMMEQFRIHCVGHSFPQTFTVDGKERCFVELETRDCSEEALILLIHCATAVGKTVVNFRLAGYDVLGVDLGTTNCTINGQKAELPIIGSRDDMLWGDLAFCNRYPEPGLLLRFRRGESLELPQLPEKAKLRAVMTRRYFAYLIYMEKQINKALVFNDKHFVWQIEDEKLVDEVMRGDFYMHEG